MGIDYKEILDIISKKRDYLNQMLIITNEQTEAIESEQDKKLGQLIDQKQILINSIDVLDKVFLEKMEIIKKYYNVSSLEDIKENTDELKLMQNGVLEINEIIKKIFSKEKENSVKLNKEFDDIKDKLKEISGSKKAASAYGRHDAQNSGGVFFDNKK